MDDAQARAQSAGLQISQAKFVQSNDQPEGTITAQDPGPGATTARGSVVSLTIVTGRQLVVVPDLRGRVEADALAAISSGGFTVGLRTEAYDTNVPVGSLVSQDPRAGLQVATGTAISYVVSLGPQPSANPSPSPAGSPSPAASPSPSPSPATANVGDYRCSTFAEARNLIARDGFILGSVGGLPSGHSPADGDLVASQQPNPGTRQPAGSQINLTVYDGATYAGPCPSSSSPAPAPSPSPSP